MKFFPRLFALFCALGLMTQISACGQKGKLVMPVRPPAISTPYPVAQPKPKPDADSDQMDPSGQIMETGPDKVNDAPEPAKDSTPPEKN